MASHHNEAAGVGLMHEGGSLPAGDSSAGAAADGREEVQCSAAPGTACASAWEPPLASPAINGCRSLENLALVVRGDAPDRGLEFLDAVRSDERSSALFIETQVPVEGPQSSVAGGADIHRWDQWAIDAEEGQAIREPSVFSPRFEAKSEQYQILARQLLLEEQSTAEPGSALSSPRPLFSPRRPVLPGRRRSI